MGKRREALVKKYGSEKAYREHMREIRRKVKNHPGGSFRDRELAKEMSKKALERRWHSGKNDN